MAVATRASKYPQMYYDTRVNQINQGTFDLNLERKMDRMLDK